MSPADFSDLTPPQELLDTWQKATGSYLSAGVQRKWEIAASIYRAGAQHGHAIGKQEWPEPITDREPNNTDANKYGFVQVLCDGAWELWNWDSVITRVTTPPWLHCPDWQPKPPSLREQWQEALARIRGKYPGYECADLDLIERALQGEEAGE